VYQAVAFKTCAIPVWRWQDKLNDKHLNVKVSEKKKKNYVKSELVLLKFNLIKTNLNYIS